MTELEHESAVRALPERRGGSLIAWGITLMIGAIVGMLIAHSVITARARSSPYGSGSLASFYAEASRLNDLTAQEGALDIAMGLVIVIGLALLIVGIVQRVRSA